MIIIMDMADGSIDTRQCPTQDCAPGHDLRAEHEFLLRHHHALQPGLQEVAAAPCTTPSAWHPGLH